MPRVPSSSTQLSMWASLSTLSLTLMDANNSRRIVDTFRLKQLRRAVVSDCAGLMNNICGSLLGPWSGPILAI